MDQDKTEAPKKTIISRITDALFTEEGIPALDAETKQDIESITKEIEQFDWNVLLQKIRENVEQKGSTIKKFMSLVESLEDVIPDEDKRYRAAYKALTTTSGKNRDDILNDTARQFEELKQQKSVFNRTVNEWRNRLQEFAEQSKEIRRDIAVLQEKVRSLEKQERKILDLAGEKERQIKSAEVKFGDFLRNIEQDINTFSNRILNLLPKE